VRPHPTASFEVAGALPVEAAQGVALAAADGASAPGEFHALLLAAAGVPDGSLPAAGPAAPSAAGEALTAPAEREHGESQAHVSGAESAGDDGVPGRVVHSGQAELAVPPFGALLLLLSGTPDAVGRGDGVAGAPSTPSHGVAGEDRVPTPASAPAAFERGAVGEPRGATVPATGEAQSAEVAAAPSVAEAAMPHEGEAGTVPAPAPAEAPRGTGLADGTAPLDPGPAARQQHVLPRGTNLADGTAPSLLREDGAPEGTPAPRSAVRAVAERGDAAAVAEGAEGHPPGDDGGGGAAEPRAVRTVGSARGVQSERGVRRGPEVAEAVHELVPRERGADGAPRGLGIEAQPAAHGSVTGEVRVEPPATEAGEQAPPAPPRFVEQVVDAVVELESDREARVHLDPPELGDVLLRLRLDAGSLHVDIRVERFEALQLFVVHRPLLEQQLGGRGFVLGGLALALASDGSGDTGRGGAFSRDREAESSAGAAGWEPSERRRFGTLRRRFNPNGTLTFYV